MKLITLALISLTLLCAFPLFATPNAHEVTDRDEASKGPIPLIGLTRKPRIIDPLIAEAGDNAQNAITQGEALLRQGKTDAALSSFRSAMQYLPNDALALERIAETYASAGRLAEAGQTYYKLFHEARWQDVSGNPSVYLGYSLVLAQTGQPDQAIQFYQEAADRIDYSIDGAQKLKVLLPQIVIERTLPDQVSYTPEHLQALTETALAHEEMGFGSNKEALAHMKDAVTLYPDSAVTHYYLGEALPSGNPQEKTEYQKAAELGDDKTVAAAKERLSVIR